MKKYNKDLIGLERKTFKKCYWAVDSDYYDQLNLEQKRFMSRFNNEFYKGNVKKGDPNALHKSDELRKDCYTRNNIANRDIYARVDALKLLTRLDQEPDEI